jgi:hypothetical protein
MESDTPTVPTEPVAETPVIASETPPAVTVPTDPVADTPVSGIWDEATTDPTEPVAETPVNATVTFCPARELNGVAENEAPLNMDQHGVSPVPR